MPGPTAVSFVSPDDPAQKAGAFSEHQMWVTPYHPEELYAAGSLRDAGKRVRRSVVWSTQANRAIENTRISLAGTP